MVANSNTGNGIVADGIIFRFGSQWLANMDAAIRKGSFSRGHVPFVPKAAEDCRNPRRWRAVRQRFVLATLLECGNPLPLFH